MSTSMLLDRTTWDLVLDAAGNIALASEPYSQAQDAASAVKVFQGELWYDTTLGLPYFSQILGRLQPLQIFRARAIEAAKTVPGVTDAKVYVSVYRDRAIRGQLIITTQSGQTGASF